MKMTNLALVQAILNKTSGDEVNSCGDTVESLQVLHELRNTYYHMIGNIDRPNEFGFVELEASGDVARPTHMRFTDNVDHVKWIKYRDTVVVDQEQYKEVCYITPEQFVEKVTQFTGQDDVLLVEDFSGAKLPIKQNKQPQWFTTFDDEWLVFDSYDITQDDTLQVSKTIAWGKTIPTFGMNDTDYPDLPAKYFPQLLSEATVACMWYLKQQQDPVDITRARQQYVRHFNNRNRIDVANNEVPDFGRR